MAQIHKGGWSCPICKTQANGLVEGLLESVKQECLICIEHVTFDLRPVDLFLFLIPFMSVLLSGRCRPWLELGAEFFFSSLSDHLVEWVKDCKNYPWLGCESNDWEKGTGIALRSFSTDTGVSMCEVINVAGVGTCSAVLWGRTCPGV